MVGLFELDEKDKMILEVLEENPEMSQNEIAKIVGLSQPSVGARIKKMKELGIINHAYGINLKNPGLYILKVDIKCRQPRELLKLFEGCPFFLNGFIGIHIKKDGEPSCGSNCEECDYWINELCLGCPVTGHYRGKVWK